MDTRATPITPNSGEGAGTPPDMPIPALLRESSNPQREWRSTLGWLLLCLPLMAALVLQAGYFYREPLLAQQPDLRPYLATLCHYADCELPPLRRPEAFALIHRDIRVHPTRDNALLIDASFINEADFAQPYPLLEIRLTDVRGGPVASGRFVPDEYLGRTAEGLVAPHTEIHFSLAVGDPGPRAVSFEFDFR